MLITEEPTVYWENRARRYALDGEGLAAVCSYGMPGFYNRTIQFTQRLALRPWLRDLGGKQVLDVGCGIGRWSLWMAAQGANVTGVDLSTTMVAEASRRTARAGLSKRCHFLVQDLADLYTGVQYDFVLGVTVLQHILKRERLEQTVRRLAAHLAPGGRMVLIEAAPNDNNSSCDTAIFRARTLADYARLFAMCGLRLFSVTGVDPSPLRTRFLPYYRRLPKPIALGGLAMITAIAAPTDAILGRRLINRSWHKLFVLEHDRGNGNAE